jgi:hypothetical protein
LILVVETILAVARKPLRPLLQEEVWLEIRTLLAKIPALSTRASVAMIRDALMENPVGISIRDVLIMSVFARF